MMSLVRKTSMHYCILIPKSPSYDNKATVISRLTSSHNMCKFDFLILRDENEIDINRDFMYV